jgi:hypothetical protein
MTTIEPETLNEIREKWNSLTPEGQVQTVVGGLMRLFSQTCAAVISVTEVLIATGVNDEAVADSLSELTDEMERAYAFLQVYFGGSDADQS